MTGQNKAFEFRRVRIPQLCCLAIQWTRAELPIWLASGDVTWYEYQHILVRVSQQTLKTNQHTLDIVHSTPFVLQDIQTYPPTEVDIRMEDRCLEEDSGWRIGIVGRELERQLQSKVGIGCVCRTGYGCIPIKEVLSGRGES